ncbi:MAG: hypothetical protein IPK72_10915 [Candidatus Eisenbacteria bacterium]|nr:hypothetical protein [Candidatus Eisenbacteria bacterium]
MIRDGILAPGTQVEYFITPTSPHPDRVLLLSGYVGKNYFEFEIFPSCRMDAGTKKFRASCA